MGPARAAAAARTAPAAGLFLSLGCGGGLLPWLRTGDIVVATEVVRLDASCRPEACTAAVLPRVELGAHTGGGASSPAPLATAGQKTPAAGRGGVPGGLERLRVGGGSRSRRHPARRGARGPRRRRRRAGGTGGGGRHGDRGHRSLARRARAAAAAVDLADGAPAGAPAGRGRRASHRGRLRAVRTSR